MVEEFLKCVGFFLFGVAANLALFRIPRFLNWWIGSGSQVISITDSWGNTYVERQRLVDGDFVEETWCASGCGSNRANEITVSISLRSPHARPGTRI